MSSVPSIDLTGWFRGGAADRAAVATAVDAALQDAGFLLITGHGVPAALRDGVRAATREFFALPTGTKRRYAATIGQRGWIPPGVEANGYVEGTETPPDLKETFAVGADQPTGDPDVDRAWFLPNVWPAEVPAVRATVTDYLARMRALADELLVICAAALGLPPRFFAGQADHPSYTMNINFYPPLRTVGEVQDGQFRIGPHTDFGTVTILDRQSGLGGLQVWTGDSQGADGEWVDAPFDPAAFTINIGDLLARWTGDRWRSTRHRVLPPDPRAPEEELLSLIFFYEVNPDARVASLGPPIGRVAYPPVRAADYLAAKLAAITIG
jgi:isopenicillin N synthase-like dioxygenase